MGYYRKERRGEERGELGRRRENDRIGGEEGKEKERQGKERRGNRSKEEERR